VTGRRQNFQADQLLSNVGLTYFEERPSRKDQSHLLAGLNRQKNQLSQCEGEGAVSYEVMMIAFPRSERNAVVLGNSCESGLTYVGTALAT
jgi:hypothetical protein